MTLPFALGCCTVLNAGLLAWNLENGFFKAACLNSFALGVCLTAGFSTYLMRRLSRVPR